MQSVGLQLASSSPVPVSSRGGARSFPWRIVVLAASHLLWGVEEYALGRHEAVDRLEEPREHRPGVGKQRLDDLALRLVKKG
ncbi:MAG: hypothetical protein IJC66_08215 [Kiritimatiellae bacterium]|nr:hypothetical protein [Kiritimatiellia bacterium]